MPQYRIATIIEYSYEYFLEASSPEEAVAKYRTGDLPEGLQGDRFDEHSPDLSVSEGGRWKAIPVDNKEWTGDWESK